MRNGVLPTTVCADNSRMMKGLRLRVRLLAGVFVAVLAVIAAPATAGTLRLEWDPNPEPSVTGYRVYIGTASGQYDRVEDLGVETTFAMTDALPGVRYFFAVAAVAGWRLSEKSVEVSAVWQAPRVSGAGAPAPAHTASPSSSPVARVPSGETCAGASGNSCFQFAQISPLLGGVHSLSASPDGLVFVVEDHQRIRVLAGGQPAARPAYVATDARLEQVVVDPAFARTRWVFVSELVPRRDGTLELQ